jgi:VWFA-related protein
MSMVTRLGFVLLAPLLWAAGVSSQQGNPATPPNTGRITLDVVVAKKSGPAISGLQQQDFVILDNKVPQKITSFQALGGNQAPIEVIVVIDAVNTGMPSVDFERQSIEKYLRSNGGHLTHPSTIAILTDTGIKLMQDGFTSDGNTLSATLEQQTVSLRSINRSAAFWGAVDRFQISLDAFRELAAREASRPGRKIILWISPGWPLLSGPEVLLDFKERQQIFANIVSLSTLLQEARITLYSIDPLGSNDFGPRTFYYGTFVKGISKPNQVDLGDVGLQVLAVQSGGLALNINNDVTGQIEKCISDTDAYYEISFDEPVDSKRDEYHQLEVKLENSGLTARTRHGYYANPDAPAFQKVPISQSPIR